MSWNAWLWAWGGFTVGSLAGVGITTFFYWLHNRDQEQDLQGHPYDPDCYCTDCKRWFAEQMEAKYRDQWRGE